MSDGARTNRRAGLHCAACPAPALARAWPQAGATYRRRGAVAQRVPGTPGPGAPLSLSGARIQQAAHHLVSGFQDLDVGQEGMFGTHLVNHVLRQV